MTDINEIANTIHNMCFESEKDGAIKVGLWVLNNCHLSDKDCDALASFLYKEYDFLVEG